MTVLFIDSGSSTQNAAVCFLRVYECSWKDAEICLGDDTLISNAAEGKGASVCVIDACHKVSAFVYPCVAYSGWLLLQ